MKEKSSQKDLIFYDGDCGFCNSAVQFIVQKRKKEFYFVSLQSKLAQEILAEHDIKIVMDTIYYLKNNKVYERSSAAIEISRGLKGMYPIMAIFYIIPRFIRDWVYNGIAKRRHRIRKGFCVIPDQKDEKFFIGE